MTDLATLVIAMLAGAAAASVWQRLPPLPLPHSHSDPQPAPAPSSGDIVQLCRELRACGAEVSPVCTLRAGNWVLEMEQTGHTEAQIHAIAAGCLVAVLETTTAHRRRADASLPAAWRQSA